MSQGLVVSDRENEKTGFCDTTNAKIRNLSGAVGSVNVELTGAARLYRAASSDRRERG